MTENYPIWSLILLPMIVLIAGIYLFDSLQKLIDLIVIFYHYTVYECKKILNSKLFKFWIEAAEWLGCSIISQFIIRITNLMFDLWLVWKQIFKK